MAESISLAVLENLVHMSHEDFPTGYVVVGATIPNAVEIWSEEQLRRSFGALSPQLLGNRWIESLSSAVLRVPSAVVPQEFNYLLNPKHPAFPDIVPEIPVPYLFDPRLFSSTTTGQTNLTYGDICTRAHERPKAQTLSSMASHCSNGSRR